MKIIKHYFNLIEIALAVAIIAVGMSSIMVLFPVGTNAANAAAADNMIPDVADYVLSYLECRTQAEWRNASGVAQANGFIGNLAGKLEDLSGDDEGADDTKWSDISDTNLSSRQLGGKTVFRFKQTYEINADGENVKVSDFSAVIRVWAEKVPFRLRKTDGSAGAYDAGDTDSASSYAIALCAEISYPAEKPYAEREKYTFRREIYNHAESAP